MLLALAILIILLALAMIPISRHQRSIRQSELDSKAETIYLAAQNRLSQLQASGRSDEYGKDRATALNNIPWDAEQDKYTTSTLYYVTSAAKSTDTSAAGSILPREQVEAELSVQELTQLLLGYHPEHFPELEPYFKKCSPFISLMLD